MKNIIIMPAYNAAKTIEKSINSVINQDFQDWILYIIDDCSNDSTIDIISKISDKRIFLKRNFKNMGVAYSRNSGLDEARLGDNIFFIDSDDVWIPTKLGLQIDALDKNNIVCTNYYYIGNRINKIRSKYDWVSNDNFLKKKVRICFSSLGYKINNINLKLRFRDVGHEDFVFINSLLELGDEIFCLPLALVEMYKVEGSLSSNKKKAIAWHYKNLREIFPNNINKANIYMIFYIYNGFLFSRKNK